MEKLNARNNFKRRISSRKKELLKQNQRANNDYARAIADINENRNKGKSTVDAVARLASAKRQKKKMKKILRAEGLGDFVNETGVHLLDLLRSLIDSCQAARDIIGEELLRTLIDIMTTLYNVWRNPTWESLVVNATSLFLRYFDQYITDLLIDWLKDMLRTCTAQASSSVDSVTEWITALFTGADSLINDELWEKVGEFTTRLSVVIAAGQDLINIEQIDFASVIKKFKEMKAFWPKVKDVADMMFQSIRFVFGSWDKILAGDFSFLFLGKSEAQEFEIEVRLLEQAFPLVQAMQEIELRTLYNMTISEYEQRVDRALKKARSMIARCSSVQQKMSISNFIRNLSSIQGGLFARIADAPVSEQAYAIKLAGPSSCGKSTLVNLLSQTLLSAYGLNPSDKGQLVFTNIEERFESTIKPSHKIICADDVANNANTKPNYDRVLNYVNSVPRPLEKAGVDEKGILYPGNVAFICTTNDEEIKAMECSVCPESILRRFTLDVTVQIKEEYRTEYGGLKPQEGMNLSVYNLILKRFSHIERHDGKPPIVVWDVIPREEWNTMGDDDHDIHAACQFIARDVQRHRAAQKKIMETQKQLANGEFCAVCRTPQVLCTCEECAQAELGNFLTSLSTAQLWDLRVNLNLREMAWNNATKMLMYKAIWCERKAITRIAMGIIGSLLFASILSVNIARLLLVIWSVLGYRKYTTIVDNVNNELNRRADRLSAVCHTVEEHLNNNVRKYFAIGGALLALYGFYRAVRPMIRTQDVRTFIDPVLKSNEVSMTIPKGHVLRTEDERDYKEGYSRLAPRITHTAETTTAKDLVSMIAKRLRLVIVEVEDATFSTVNGLMVASNIIMIPAHSLPKGNFTIETTSTPGVPSAKTKDKNLTQNYVHIVPGKDVALVQLPSAPPAANLLDYFPESEPTFYAKATRMLWKSPSNEVITSVQAIRPLDTDVSYQHSSRVKGWLFNSTRNETLTLKKNNGFRSDLEFNTYQGLCGAPFIDKEKAIIYGFHVAGYGTERTSFATYVLKKELEAGIASISQSSSHLVAHSEGNVRVDAYGSKFRLENRPPLYCREDGTQEKTIVSYLGKVVDESGAELQSNARSPYVPTPFKGIVEEFGECTHIPPTKVNSTEKTMKTLNKLTDPVQHYDIAILERAIADYKDQTTECVRNNKDDLKDVLKIFTQQEALDGTNNGVMFGIPNSTSGGFPMNKSKKQALIRDPMNEAEVQVPRQLNGEFNVQQEIDIIMDEWSQSRRSETIFKASSKVNELLPRKKAIDKVRKFYGSQFGFLVASRRVLGGMPYFMRKFWRETECLVGIDPGSREWSELHDYVTEYTRDHMIAGDFSGFDTRMAAQITLAAADIIRGWYKEMGCSDEDLKLLDGALSDICNPNILMDSDLYRFANANPSGQPITVQLNSICNSIMMRYVYYALRPKIKENFSKNIRLATYGDDNGMGVAPHCTFYTHTACQEEFEKIGIGYTMADKNAESKPYITIDELSFLKRGFIYHADLGRIAAPIELDSIYKKYHFVKKASECPLSASEQYGAYTDSALREAYLHGREFYDNFLASLKTIQEKNESLHGQFALIPYDEMGNVLKPKYREDYVNTGARLFD